ncbi:DUF1642 domain-containing protein [Enterococcus faecalis]
MAKKELIEKWESKEGVPSYEISAFPVNPSLNEMYIAGYGVARKEILDDLKQLDEPKKVVVPKFVAEWIEYAKKKGDSLIDSFNPWDLYGAEYIDATRWIDNNQETFALAWVNGYEVEKEQLYKVVIDHKYLVQIFSGRTDARLVEYEELTNWHDSAYKLTESVIKSIDERYWPFAVKVGNK